MLVEKLKKCKEIYSIQTLISMVKVKSHQNLFIFVYHELFENLFVVMNLVDNFVQDNPN